ncbi:MAG TPA: hypothetical protein VNO81_07595, partial [Candidatus Nitrosotenuis sp.]|nr:hypothetical protein [Candidatus Nitrosotenuis sp.]
MPIVLTGGAAMLPGKQQRQSHIADILARHAVASQEELVALLRGRGIEARQSTVSRDIKEMGVIRRAEGGSYRYCLPGAAPAAPSPSLAEVLARHLLRVDGNELL